MPLTVPSQNFVLDLMMGTGHASEFPATWHMALFTADPGTTGDANDEVTTAGGTDYDRVAITNNSTNFPDASSGLKVLATRTDFPSVGASWGTITHWALCVSGVPGTNDLRIVGEFTVPKTPGVGNTPYIKADAIEITIGNCI